MTAPDDDCGHCSYRAWTWRGGGAPGELTLDRVEMPELGAGEALVRNAAIGLNPVDWKLLAAPPPSWHAGHVPGVDGAGTVIAVGDDLPSGWLGQRVAYHQNLHKPGSFADYTALPARALLRLPETLDFATAAGIPCPALTAWLALEKLPARPGARVLVSGAGGAVGNYLVQLAVARGFTVTALCHPRHWERLRRLGAGDCRPGPLADDGAWPTAEAGRFFAVIDSISADHATRLAPALEANGHLVCIQGRPESWPCPPFGPALSMHEVALGALHLFGDDDAWRRLTAAGVSILGDVAAGRLQPETLVAGDFDALPQMLEALRQRRFSGKPILRLT
ncbi:zinc-binding dehydrogenase [Ancylobacter sp. Lp-2]|uniref:zinc-binding dehydrogenase n=1 Tax=Ancylobacter sp. Lp-2 TaxID=2881339 RepID=UPI001E652B1A|nr:zinc-binding dehydrogenase [Ancylobacter sp. Lp-2]MCB4767748.1 zinc-binding dehydrogenase [Ancylobacter sp. Lp-2]